MKFTMKISYCTPMMNRLFHLKETLPKNILCTNHLDVEFIILNYNSQDNMNEWIFKNFEKELKSERVKLYHTEEPQYWHETHTKNVAHIQGSGDILVNLDGDNYVVDGFTEWCVEQFKKNDNKEFICVKCISDNLPFMKLNENEFFMIKNGINNPNDVLKFFDGPANTVNPEVKPPSGSPDNATLIIGTFVGTISWLEKILDLSRDAVSLILEFFCSLSIIPIFSPSFVHRILARFFYPLLQSEFSVVL